MVDRPVKLLLAVALIVAFFAIGIAQAQKEDGHFHGALPPRAPAPKMLQWDIDTICRRPFKLCGYDWGTDRRHVWLCRLSCGCEERAE